MYATRTKHSKKLAEAVAHALNTKAENIVDQPKIKDTGLLFIVGGIYGGESLPELVSFVKDLDGHKVKAAALITSCASGKQKQKSIRSILAEKDIPVLGEVIVPGAILIARMGHPNRNDLEKAVEFAKGLIK